MMSVRFPLNLRNVEDLLFGRGIDLRHLTVLRFRALLERFPTRVDQKNALDSLVSRIFPCAD